MNQLSSRTATNRSGNRRGMGRALGDYLDAWEQLEDVDAVADLLGVDRKACRARLRQLGVLEVQAKPLPVVRYRCPECLRIGTTPVCGCGVVINPFEGLG